MERAGKGDGELDSKLDEFILVQGPKGFGKWTTINRLMWHGDLSKKNIEPAWIKKKRL
jgi:hypothetical protein